MHLRITKRRIRDGRRLVRRVLPHITQFSGHNIGWRVDNINHYITAELEAFFLAALPRHQTIYITNPERFISAAVADLKNEAGTGARWKIRQWREGEL